MKRVYYLTRIFAGVLCMILCVVCMPGFNASAEETNTVNITQNGKATVSVSTESSRALGLIDGDNTVTAVYPNENGVGSWGYWSAGAQTATIDLGANYNLTQLKLYLGTNGGSQLPEKFILYSSLDGNTFEKFCESDSINNKVYTADIQKVLAARYVKLEIPAATAARAICVREIEIYGTFNSYVTTNLTQNGKTTVTNTSINTCGDYSVATKPKYVEILDFKHFVKHTVFNSEGDKFRNKEIKNYVVVKVVIDMVCGNTKKQ